MLLVRRMLGGLAASVQATPSDDARLLGELVVTWSAQAGRVMWGRWSAGDALICGMRHAGPPRDATPAADISVGLPSIRRFRRPMARKALLELLLPLEILDENAKRLAASGYLGSDSHDH
jgi:hypothetical protein